MFSFAHLLSRVRFEIENSSLESSGYGIQISDITINGTKQGDCSYTLGANNLLSCTWTEDTKGDYVYEFNNAILDPGHGVLVEHFVIPQNNDIDVTFTVSSYVKEGGAYGSIPTSVETHTVSLNHGFTGTGNEHYWKEGCVYNYLIKVGATVSYIKFDASVSDWDYGNDDNGNDDDITTELN